MAVNEFFQGPSGVGDTSEQNLVEDNIIETIQLAGQDLHYIPRSQNNVDEILNENPLAQFKSYKIIEFYLDSPVGFGGEGYVVGPHGLEINQQSKWTVSRKRFAEETGTFSGPNEGDLLYWPLNKTLWEIKRVNHEPEAMWQLKELYVYTVTANLFTYTYQDFTTGIAEVDNDMNSAIFTTPFDDSQAIEDAADDVLDFTEENPFGRITPKE